MPALLLAFPLLGSEISFLEPAGDDGETDKRLRILRRAMNPTRGSTTVRKTSAIFVFRSALAPNDRENHSLRMVTTLGLPPARRRSPPLDEGEDDEEGIRVDGELVDAGISGRAVLELPVPLLDRFDNGTLTPSFSNSTAAPLDTSRYGEREPPFCFLGERERDLEEEDSRCVPFPFPLPFAVANPSPLIPFVELM